MAYTLCRESWPLFHKNLLTLYQSFLYLERKKSVKYRSGSDDTCISNNNTACVADSDCVCVGIYIIINSYLLFFIYIFGQILCYLCVILYGINENSLSCLCLPRI